MAKKKSASLATVPENQTPFRQAERRYKRRDIQPDFSDCLDTARIRDDARCLNVRSSPITDLENQYFNNHSAAIEIYSVPKIPGLLIIPNPFSARAQKQLILRALSDYTRPPNTSNLDAHWHIEKEGLWQSCRRSFENMPVVLSSKSGKELERKSTGYLDGREEKENQDQELHLTEQKPIMAMEALYRLRWITLGMVYDWYTKQYVRDPSRELIFPLDFAELCRDIVRVCAPEIMWRKGAEGAGKDMEGDDPEKYCARRRQQMQAMGMQIPADDVLSGDEEKFSVSGLPLVQGYDKEFRAEAGIVNFYQLRDTLTGHVDRSEVNMEAPLISMSLGHACVFLLGGPTRDTHPLPLILRSGDILVLSGDARRAFHGVPRIIEGSLPDYLRDWDPDAEDLEVGDALDQRLARDFIQTTRINMNARQVYF